MANIVLTDEFTHALDLLHRGENLFLTGKAGTGKSTLIRHFMAETKRRVVVAAPTGIAALNVDGYTIHRLFGFSPKTTIEQVRSKNYAPGTFAKTLKSLDTLIIDEASMIRADLFDKMATALQRFGPRPRKPFGGVQVVLVGDLFQLPPVVQKTETDFFATRYTSPYFFSADSYQEKHFATVSLTHVFRQQGDQQLASVLNAIREGLFLDEAQSGLNDRIQPEFVPPRDEFWLTLAPTNRIVGARNRERLEELPGETFTNLAQKSGDLTDFDPPTDAVLDFKIGAQIMMLNNDWADRWVNGTLGTIMSVDYDKEGIIVTARLRDGRDAHIRPHVWEVTRPGVSRGALHHEVIGSYTQLPFKLAWAITIHKSQGQTLERLIVDLSGGTFAYGQLYVALSRAVSMDGLVLKRGVAPKDLKTDRRIHRFLNASRHHGGPRQYCALAISTVGDEGRMSRPRPVEIALAFADGPQVSSLINPQRDLGTARSDYGIDTSDILLAPTLAEIWPALAAMMDGATLVGLNTDHTLGLIDHELKRLGVVTPLPLGADLPANKLRPKQQAALTTGSAVERARAALEVQRKLRWDDPTASVFEDTGTSSSEIGYLLTREFEAPIPNFSHSPVLSSLVVASWAVSRILVGGASASDMTGHRVTDPAVIATVKRRIETAIQNSAGLPPQLLQRVQQIEAYLGQPITLPKSQDDAQIGEVLTPGARVCFTGSVHDLDGEFVGKIALQQVVADAGLAWAPNVSKTRCDALVVAELGTQSGKARKAKEFGKPVFSAEEFFQWHMYHAPVAAPK